MPPGGGGPGRLDTGQALSYAWARFSENIGAFMLLVVAVFVATVVASLHTGRHAPPGVTVRLPLVYATMHHAWGVGMLIGPR